MAGLKASSLETLVQLVAMGMGVTLVPALSVHGGRLAADGVILREIGVPQAYRRIGLVYRSTFPRRAGLTLLADNIRQVLPNRCGPCSDPPFFREDRSDGARSPGDSMGGA
ncbi:MAG: hypothetical protein Ct9H300mP16_08180 [Pseudomonadota bacterium]|nr:MAG: hypothetical protein Ct9H300mP16_08180 [Pseudomonadota bacterium]